MNIHEAPHGMNLVVETDEPAVCIGRFDSVVGFQAMFHDCDLHPLAEGEDVEAYVKKTATYGVAVNHKDVLLDTARIQRVRLLGDIEK